LLAVRVVGGTDGGIAEKPEIRCGKQCIGLRGDWQFRIGDNPGWGRYVLPARFTATTDVIFEGANQPVMKEEDLKE
jgi:hypothetical protein